jgi:dUTP pyrophosphatase
MSKIGSTLQAFKLSPDAVLPTRNNTDDAGADIYALHDVFIPLGKTVKIETGIALNILPGEVGRLAGRSSMNSKGIITAHGVIDAGYSGDISVVLSNFSYDKDFGANPNHGPYNQPGYQVKAGDKVAQLLVEPVLIKNIEEVDTLWTSVRSNRGFGSSGR